MDEKTDSHKKNDGSNARLSRTKASGRRPGNDIRPLAWAGIEAIQRLTVQGAEDLKVRVYEALENGDYSGWDRFSSSQIVEMAITAKMLFKDIEEHGVRVKTFLQGPDGKIVEAMKENPSVIQLKNLNVALGVTGGDMALTKRSRGESALNESQKRELDERAELIRSLPRGRMPTPRREIGSAITVEVERS